MDANTLLLATIESMRERFCGRLYRDDEGVAWKVRDVVFDGRGVKIGVQCLTGQWHKDFTLFLRSETVSEMRRVQ